jgi:hypothetical protein
MGFSVPVIRQNQIFLTSQIFAGTSPSLSTTPISPPSHHVYFITKTRSTASGFQSLCYRTSEILCATVLIEFQYPQTVFPPPITKTLNSPRRSQVNTTQRPTVSCLTAEATDPAAAAVEVIRTVTTVVTAPAATAEEAVVGTAEAATEGKSSLCSVFHQINIHPPLHQ